MTRIVLDPSQNFPGDVQIANIQANFVDLYAQVAAVPGGGATGVNAQTVSYTGVLGDAGKLVQMNSSSAQNFTVPNNSTVAYAIGARIEVEQIGTGVTTIVAAGGVTINSDNGLVFFSQYQSATLIKSAVNTWELSWGVAPKFANLLLTGLLTESSAAAITANATQNQSSATQLTVEVNNVTTNATAGNGVALPAAVAGLTILVANSTPRALQVYGNNASADTINGVATGTGVSQMANSIVLYTCIVGGASGQWASEGLGTGYAGSNQTFSTADALSANSGAVQAGATPITTSLARFTTVGGANYSAALPASAAGLEITVINAGANTMTIWPNGASDTINGNNNASGIPYALSKSGVVTFACTVAGAWHTLAGSAFSPSVNAGLTAATTISNQQTPTTGGVTLTNQTLVAGAAWRVRAYGTYTSASSATARNAEFQAKWGTNLLTKVVAAVLVNTAQTSNWEVEFVFEASSTTAAWVTGKLSHHLVTAIASAEPQPLLNVTPTSVTGLTAGPQTIDCVFDTSASVPGDSFSVQSVTIERLV